MDLERGGFLLIYLWVLSVHGDGVLQASGEVTSPARRPAPVKVRIPATVGLLPGFLYSSNGDSPVILWKVSEMACLAQL